MTKVSDGNDNYFYYPFVEYLTDGKEFSIWDIVHDCVIDGKPYKPQRNGTDTTLTLLKGATW
jgi:hypothetical protein